MKNILTILICALVVSTFMGCEDFLDESPNSTFGIDEFYSSTEEAEIALAGMYRKLAQDPVYGRNLSIIMDTGTDESFYNRRANDNWTVGLYRMTNADSYIREFWYNLYQVINLSNLFIEKLDENSFDEAEYNSLIGEARFLRGHSYFLLTSWFNEVPMPLQPTGDQENNNMPASTLEELYGQIVKDFEFAAEYLPGKGDSAFVPGRANKMAAHGLLARVYLKMAGAPFKDQTKYEEAARHAKIVIDAGTYALNTSEGNGYRNHFLSYIQSNYDQTESLWEISYAYLRDQGIIVDGRIGGLNGIPFNYGGGQEGYPGAYAQMGATSLLHDLYDDHDLRKAWNLPGFFYNNQGEIKKANPLTVNYTPGKYRRWEPVNFDDIGGSLPAGQTHDYVVLETGSPLNKNFTPINFPVLRYADILLMYAEAVNEVNGGPNSEAITAVNLVRERAGLGSIEDENPSAIANRSNFFDYLVNERMRELAFEGLGKMDLIRWGLLGERLKLLEQNILGSPYYKSDNADIEAFMRPIRYFDPVKNLSLPYPLQEVQINDALEQKDGW